MSASVLSQQARDERDLRVPSSTPPPLPEEEEPPLPDEEEPVLEQSESAGSSENPQQSHQPHPQILHGKNGWSAIYEPNSSQYYYYNQSTGATTWQNPFSNINPQHDSINTNKREFYHEEDDAIDPELAHLMPSSSTDPAGSVQAKFNARTGQFNSKSWQTPEHVSAINKSRRQQAAFFDLDAFERQRNDDHMAKKAKIDELGKDSVKPKLSKDQVKMYKEQKAAKRYKTKTDWLVNDDK
ncbi:hypothetical protein E3P89_01092 [Wallemia ichthyophaga]|uniref:WW domain-containing protein n=1 Tax=Wallemia ichthyophaga TaxID=245174 RepID=A0A4T0F403_WALIC|nr:hypothetical protein E3P98_01365 [Wallemia ichthyophaga]TIA91875.1 hypothetical protein E3P97_01753 [Wallemia ichthyophaga]TIA98453.1 hypothetical protein E3P96_03158 [Wallemia ichthyophaga]TIB13747.1 hypothetical protein E3P90_01492 [Wallemia ichthyophaga]TIB15641.1 hypothetical protein E3P93_01243 [Wallemia ichthyophaga]